MYYYPQILTKKKNETSVGQSSAERDKFMSCRTLPKVSRDRTRSPFDKRQRADKKKSPPKQDDEEMEEENKKKCERDKSEK